MKPRTLALAAIVFCAAPGWANDQETIVIADFRAVPTELRRDASYWSRDAEADLDADRLAAAEFERVIYRADIWMAAMPEQHRREFAVAVDVVAQNAKIIGAEPTEPALSAARTDLTAAFRIREKVLDSQASDAQKDQARLDYEIKRLELQKLLRNQDMHTCEAAISSDLGERLSDAWHRMLHRAATRDATASVDESARDDPRFNGGVDLHGQDFAFGADPSDEMAKAYAPAERKPVMLSAIGTLLYDYCKTKDQAKLTGATKLLRRLERELGK